ncbi:MAG: hypothetical protein GY696_17455 [Gammaproteobacteria bacterium]|nr:hypothetical protein [Gammaproteobacteria bacterium]
MGAIAPVFVESGSPLLRGSEELTERNSHVDEFDQKKGEDGHGHDPDPDGPQDDGFQEFLLESRDIADNDRQKEEDCHSQGSGGNQRNHEIPQDSGHFLGGYFNS